MITRRNFRYCKPSRRITQTLPSCRNISHVIDWTLPGRFSKWYQRLQYWICHVQVKGNIQYGLVTLVYWLIITEARQFKSESWSPSQLLADPWYSPVFKCLLCVGDQSFQEVVDVLVCSETLCYKISQINWFKICEISRVLWWLITKHNELTYFL